MMDLGRAINADPKIDSSSHSATKELSRFEQKWSDLQLAREKLEQLGVFGRETAKLQKSCEGILPATVTMMSLTKEVDTIEV